MTIVRVRLLLEKQSDAQSNGSLIFVRYILIFVEKAFTI